MQSTIGVGIYYSSFFLKGYYSSFYYVYISHCLVSNENKMDSSIEKMNREMKLKFPIKYFVVHFH
jgi:hypothetical protein